MNKASLKHPHQKVWTYIGKVFPGIKSEKEPIHAVNQWTGELDYEDGKPVLFPYMRCKLNGEIYNNLFSEPGSAIEYDADANVVSVTLTKRDGTKITFTSPSITYELADVIETLESDINYWKEFISSKYSCNNFISSS